MWSKGRPGFSVPSPRSGDRGDAHPRAEFINENKKRRALESPPSSVLIFFAQGPGVTSDPSRRDDQTCLTPLRKRARRLRRAKFREEERSTAGTQFRTSDDSVLLAKVEFGDCV